MTSSETRERAKALLKLYPRSYAEALHINIGRNTPMPLYQWLLVSLLFSARIGANQALKAAGALFDQGWRTPAKMHATTWEQRVKVLNRNGYARYDESTARYIAAATQLLLDRYDGDLRNLREAGRRSPEKERRLVTEFKGIGDVGADIFLRQTQLVWDEVYPFADKKALASAKKIGLPHDARALADLAGSREKFVRLLDALVRAELDDKTDEIRAAA